MSYEEFDVDPQKIKDVNLRIFKEACNHLEPDERLTILMHVFKALSSEEKCQFVNYIVDHMAVGK